MHTGTTPVDREESGKETEHTGVRPSRLEALGDAIFGFALTLLALDLRLPEIESDQLAQGLLALLPKLLVFLFSFVMIAHVWYFHQRTMVHIERTDGAFIWWYLVFLMFVVLMPASADILGRYGNVPLGLACFGANLGLLAAAQCALWHHASISGRLFEEEYQPSLVKATVRTTLLSAVFFLATIPLGLLNVTLVYVLWTAWLVIRDLSSTRLFAGRRHRNPAA